MPDQTISTGSLCGSFETSLVIAHFLTGVIVGLLLGLALAPFLRSWILWQQAKEWDERDKADALQRTTTTPDPCP